MYWEYFGFKEPPFALTPNPAFLFLSSPHQEAFAHLLFAIENRVGFIELSGEVGTGKTTLVRTLLNQLDPQSYRTALIFNPTLSPLGLLKEVNGEFGIASEGNELRELHQALNAFLLEENRAGRTVVLVIDEAQNLSVEVLEHIRLISNLETDSDKLIQIVLVGQPELKNLLSRPELRQLEQRITVSYHLKSMCHADTCEYVRHRIRFAANGREPLKFSAGAMKRIFRFSRGLPRLINGVCDRALLLAYTKEANEVSPSMAATAIADLRKERPPRITAKLAAAVVVMAVVIGVTFWALPRHGQAHPKQNMLAAAPSLSRELALKELGASPEQENLYAAVNAVLDAWKMPPVRPLSPEGSTVNGLARERGLVATKISGNLEALALYDAPALLEIPTAGGEKRLLALTAIGSDGVTVAPAIAGHRKLTRAELAQIWSGQATILWKDFHRLLTREKPSEKAEGVRLLQGLLRGVGCYQGALNPKAGRKTQEALAQFQRREQVKADGKAGGQTLLLLYRRAGGFFPPGLSGR